MAINLIAKGDDFVSKGEAAAQAMRLSIKRQNTEVKYKNRHGRVTTIREYEALKKVRRGEGTITKVLGPLRKRARDMEPKVDNTANIKELGNNPETTEVNITDLRIMYLEKLGTEVPNNKKNDAEWIKSKLGE